MKRLFFAALCAGSMASQGIAAQPTRPSLQGVWRIVEARIGGVGGRTIAFGERPNLTIITARHYSRVEVQADAPRPILADVAKASADELRAARLRFDQLRTEALSPADSVTLIEQIIVE